MRHSLEMERRKRKKFLLGGIAAAVVVVMIVVVLVMMGGSSYSTKVPKVTQLTYEQALKAATAAKLNLEVDPAQDTSKVSDFKKHKVIEQDPTQGAKVDKDTLLTVTLEDVPLNEVGTNVDSTAPATTATATQTKPPPALTAPISGQPVYPFTKTESINCGHWQAGSTDYPYFGAPRTQVNSAGEQRKHGAIDVYPQGGRGTPVKAIKAGTVVQVIPNFYTRADGERTCGILIDHGDFVSFYGELTGPPQLSVGQTVSQGQQVGTVSGTAQLHFELYNPGTTARTDWYGEQPSILRDPTQFMLDLMK